MWKKLCKQWQSVAAVVLLSVCVGGCALFGAATPDSPSQGLAYAYGTVATVRQSAASALQTGTITVAQAQTVLDDTDKAREVLDTAETLLINTAASSAAPDITTYLSQAATLLAAAQALIPKAAATTTASAASAASS